MGTLRDYADIYRATKEDGYITTRKFLFWFADARITGASISLIPIWVFDTTSFESSGASGGVITMGTVMYTSLCISVTFRVVTEVKSWTEFNVLAVVMSVFAYVFLVILFGTSSAFSIAGVDLYQMSFIWESPRVWFTIISSVFVPTALQFVVATW